MRLRRLNNIIHRDLGYFIAGTAILYAISGLAVNHLDDWNPNFVIQRQDVQVPTAESVDSVSRQWVDRVLESLGEQAHYRSHDFPSSTKVKIYLDEGSVFINLKSGEGVYESVKRRPVFYQMNHLHLSPKRAWLVFSDFFAVALLVVSVSGLFVLKGKRGITGRGAVLATVGVVVPVVFMFFIG